MADATHRKTKVVLLPGEQWRTKVTVPDLPGLSLVYEMNGKDVFVLGPGDSVEVTVKADFPPAVPSLPAPSPVLPPPQQQTIAVERPARPLMPAVLDETAP